MTVVVPAAAAAALVLRTAIPHPSAFLLHSILIGMLSAPLPAL